jgi:carbon storage regulator
VLVLTRRAGQSIMIGHDIVVTVLEVRGDQIRLGIRAPREIDVHREEVFRQLQQANRSSASPNLEALEKLGSIVPADQKDKQDAGAGRGRHRPS